MLLLSIFSNNVVRIILFGTIFLGIVSGILGVFTLLKKQALIGDALSHSTLPGVVLMFIFTNTRNLGILLTGAFISAAFAMFLMKVIKKYSKIENDAILALILSSFFGLGNFLISLISRDSSYVKINFNTFIFGSAATMSKENVYTIMIILLIVLFIILLTWRNLKLHIFNSEFYESLGYSNLIMEFLISFMTILVIIVGIESVGVILMSSLLITPGLSARQWSNKLFINVLLAGLFGFIQSFLGTYISVTNDNMPTGPMIVIFGSNILLLSILLSPKRGLISHEIKRIMYKNKIKKYEDIIKLYNNENNKKELNLTKDKLVFYLNQGLIDYDKEEIILTNLGKEKVLEILGGII